MLSEKEIEVLVKVKEALVKKYGAHKVKEFKHPNLDKVGFLIKPSAELYNQVQERITNVVLSKTQAKKITSEKLHEARADLVKGSLFVDQNPQPYLVTWEDVKEYPALIGSLADIADQLSGSDFDANFSL